MMVTATQDKARYLGRLAEPLLCRLSGWVGGPRRNVEAQVVPNERVDVGVSANPDEEVALEMGEGVGELRDAEKEDRKRRCRRTKKYSACLSLRTRQSAKPQKSGFELPDLAALVVTGHSGG